VNYTLAVLPDAATAGRAKGRIAVQWSIAREASSSLKADSSNPFPGAELALNKIISHRENNGSGNSGDDLRETVEHKSSNRRDEEDNSIPKQRSNQGRGKAADRKSRGRCHEHDGDGDGEGNPVINNAPVNEAVFERPRRVG
jgi:hypothetical protein